MVISWAECICSDIPSFTKNKKICERDVRLLRRSSEDAKDGRVDVVFGGAADFDEFLHSIFIGYIVSVPSDDVERGMILGAVEQCSSNFVCDIPSTLVDIEASQREFKVSRVRKTVCTKRSELGEDVVGTKNLLDISSRRPIGKVDLEFETALDYEELSRPHHNPAELGLDVKSSQLRNDEKVAVAVAERLFVHGRVREIHVDSETFSQRRVTVPCDSLQSVNKIYRGFGCGEVERLPSELRGADVDLWV